MKVLWHPYRDVNVTPERIEVIRVDDDVVEEIASELQLHGEPFENDGMKEWKIGYLSMYSQK